MNIAVPPAPAAGRTVCLVQFQRIRKEEDTGRFSREQEYRGLEADTGVVTEGLEGATNAEGAINTSLLVLFAGLDSSAWTCLLSIAQVRYEANIFLQRQTVVSQFFEMDKLVVEGGLSVCHTVDDSSAVVITDKFSGKVKGW